MNLIITSGLNIALIAAGIVGGTMLRPASSAAPDDHSRDYGQESPALASTGDKSVEELVVPANIYEMKFSRPFVVPITDGWRTHSLVVLNVTVDIEEEKFETVSAPQSKARDKVMAALLDYSHAGGFSGPVADPVIYDAVRLNIRDALSTVFHDGVTEIRIMEMTKRSV